MPTERDVGSVHLMRIAIDPNVRVEGNQTYGGFEDLFGDVDVLQVGDWLTVMCQETDIEGNAKVTRIDHESRLIYLAVDWKTLAPPSSVGTSTGGCVTTSVTWP